MEEAGHCELCGGYSEQEQSLAFTKLNDALSLLLSAHELTDSERKELARAEVVALNMDLEHPVPAVIFPPPSPLEKFKAAFTYTYLLENALEAIAESLRESVADELAN